MSNRAQSRQRPLFNSDRPLTKSEKRAAAAAAKARLAARQRLQRYALIAGTLLFIAGLLVWSVVNLRSGDDEDAGSATGASAPASAPAAPADNRPFPPLPDGADPALGTKPTVTAGTGDVTGLKVTTLIQGQGAATQAGQQITVNYVGVSHKTGEEFDASWKRSEPFSFQLGSGNVIKGWDQGLVGVKVGSRVQLDIPSDLAYGDSAGGGSPSGPLRFVVDVLAAA